MKDLIYTVPILLAMFLSSIVFEYIRYEYDFSTVIKIGIYLVVYFVIYYILNSLLKMIMSKFK